MLERVNEELKRRTYVIRIFPNAASCLPLVRALAVGIHEDWGEQHRYLNMELLKEHRKEALRAAPGDQGAQRPDPDPFRTGENRTRPGHPVAELDARDCNCDRERVRVP